MIADMIARIAKAGFKLTFSYDNGLAVSVSGRSMVMPVVLSDDSLQCEIEVFMIKSGLMTYDDLHPAFVERGSRIVYYPPGASVWHGKTTDNAAIAQELLTYPLTKCQEFVRSMGRGWEVTQ